MVTADIETQIQDLKAEMSRLSKSVQARAGDAVDGVGDALDAVRGRANGAARSLGRQAHALGDAIGEHPRAAAVSSAGVVGLLVGLAAGYLLASGDRR